MKPKHDAKTRLEHYKTALRNTFYNYPNGLYHVCLTFSVLNKMSFFDIEIDYPEFYRFKPYYSCHLDSWFTDNEQRKDALQKCITEVTDKIYRNELD